MHITPLRDLILDEGEDGDLTMFIVMDYFPHELNTFLRETSADELSEQKIKKMVYSILCSLNFIHSANVMHRDIKPQNFLLKEDGSVVLCDFGYARSILGESH